MMSKVSSYKCSASVRPDGHHVFLLDIFNVAVMLVSS